MKPLQKILRDPAFWALMAFNIILIAEYRDDPKYYTTLVWLFWIQSVVIGLFNFFDMLTLQKVEIGNFTINDEVPGPAKAKGCLSFFFLVHYGGFHIGYLVFLFITFKFTAIDFTVLKMAFLGLLASSLIQFIQNKTVYRSVPRSITKMFFIPYLRIVPMHLTILLPEFMHWQPGLTFLVLKTIFDLIGHLATTAYYWKDKTPEPEGGFI
jgi:Family of unknown function (DUF6498)